MAELCKDIIVHCGILDCDGLKKVVSVKLVEASDGTRCIRFTKECGHWFQDGFGI